MICRDYNISTMTAEEYEKYFCLLSANRQQRIRDMKTDTERIYAVACEMLARQCLSALTDAPEFAFQILTGINKVCVVSNFSAFFSLSRADDYLCCVADKVPVGIDCRRIQPFLFSDAEKLCSDTELRHVFSRTVRSLADIVQQNECSHPDETEEYWTLYSLKEAYFTALGRIFRNPKDIHFSFTPLPVRCEDERFSVGGTFFDCERKHVYSVVRKNG